VGLIYIQWRSYARFLEQSYQRKEQNYRHLFENATDIIYTLDPTTGLFTSINRVVEDILGYTSEEIITMSLNELFTPSSLDAFQPKFQAKLQGEPQTTYEIEAIAKHVARLGLRRMDLLPFHQYARSKYASLGREYMARDLRSPDAGLMERLAAVAGRAVDDVRIESH